MVGNISEHAYFSILDLIFRIKAYQILLHLAGQSPHLLRGVYANPNLRHASLPFV